MFNFYIDKTPFSDSLQKTSTKKNDTNFKNNYRSVSILPYLPKAFEKCLHDQIFSNTEIWRRNLDQGDISVTLFTD